MGGELGENGYMYMYGWIPLLFTWNYYNIVCKSAIAQCFANKGSYSQNYGFSCSHVQIGELDHQKSWAPKTDAFELWCWRRILRVPWTARRSILKENNPDTGKDWGQEEKGASEDKMAGWHHRLNGHEFEQTWGDGEAQGTLVCLSPWRHRVRHHLATEQQQYLNTK